MPTSARAPAIADLLGAPEGKHLDRKASVFLDAAGAPRNDKGLDLATTVISFMNAEGGQILVGVRDDGTVNGIEADYRASPKRNAEGWLSRLRSLLRKHMGTHLAGLVEIDLEQARGATVAVLACPASPTPVYLRKMPTRADWLYVRENTDSIPYKGVDAVLYALGRWPDPRGGTLGPENEPAVWFSDDYSEDEQAQIAHLARSTLGPLVEQLVQRPKDVERAHTYFNYLMSTPEVPLDRQRTYERLAALCLDISISARGTERGDSVLYAYRARAMRKQNRWIEAVNSARCALTFDPDSAVAHWELARILWALEKRDEATTHVQRAAELNPSQYRDRAKRRFGLDL